MTPRPTILTIHAVDTAGDEGIVADATAIADLRCRCVQVVTSVLCQVPSGRVSLDALPLPLVAEQFEATAAQARPAAARTGIFGDPIQVEMAATLLRQSGAREVVVAPVGRVAGAPVLDDAVMKATWRLLVPLARLLLIRASDLPALGWEKAHDLGGLERAAAGLRAQGAAAVLVAGGGWPGRVVDVLDEGGKVSVFDASRIRAARIPGVAGSHAAVLAAFLGLGESLPRAVDAAQRYVGMRLGRGW